MHITETEKKIIFYLKKNECRKRLLTRRTIIRETNSNAKCIYETAKRLENSGLIQLIKINGCLDKLKLTEQGKELYNLIVCNN